MAEPHLEHQNIKIRQLIEDYRMGRIVIPEFQRDYVWKKNKAPLLVDSLISRISHILSARVAEHRGNPSTSQGSKTNASLHDELAN